LPGQWQTPSAKTIALAQDTLDGVLLGQVKGVSQSVVNGVTSLASAAATGLQALLGDPQAQQQVKTGAGAAYDYITNPDNLPYLLGALTPEQREQLAQAYETGNGQAVGQILGSQMASLPTPIGGGVLGTAKKVDEVVNIATDAAKTAGTAATDAAKAAEAAGTADVVTADSALNGAGGVANISKTIPYQPSGTVILQGAAPVCGPACAAMVITDNTGNSISLADTKGSFTNGIRPTGVSTMELSNVISNAGISNTVETTMLPSQLNQALQNGQAVIVQVPSGSSGYHFIIVDSVQSIDNVSYYMTRDPLVGPRGVLSSVLDNAISTGANAIVIGK
jgi:filamentous hemagglutinin